MIVGLITPNGKWISLDDQEITQKKQKDRFEEMFDEFYDGRILQAGAAEHLTANPEVQRVYWGKNFELHRQK